MHTLLVDGLAALGLSLRDRQIGDLLAYLDLLEKWNRSYNLSAIRDKEQMLIKHLLDSLALVPYVIKDDGQRYIDVGTGAGLPGIPLAIVFPDRHFSLLDSAGKKTRFLTHVQHSLSLSNVRVLHQRVETYRPPELYHRVLSRAFASLEDMTRLCQHLLTPQGEFWAMKGIFPADELSKVAKHYIVSEHHRLAVPGDPGERCLLVLQANG